MNLQRSCFVVTLSSAIVSLSASAGVGPLAPPRVGSLDTCRGSIRVAALDAWFPLGYVATFWNGSPDPDENAFSTDVRLAFLRWQTGHQNLASPDVVVGADGTLYFAGYRESTLTITRSELAGEDPTEAYADAEEVTTLFSLDSPESSHGWGPRLVARADGGFWVTAPGTAQDHLVARLGPDLALDESFGSAGLLSLALDPDTPLRLQELADGRLLIAGVWQDSYRVTRRLANGAVDPSFGVDGFLDVFPGSHHAPVAMGLQADGKILIAGHDPLAYQATVARVLPDGQLDPSFGDHGLLRFGQAWERSGLDLLVHEDGRILISTNDQSTSQATQVLYRFLPDGEPDVSFSPGGRYDLGMISGSKALTHLAFGVTGNILVGGCAGIGWDPYWSGTPTVVWLGGTVVLRGRVWLDSNANGSEDPGEPGVAGVEVTQRNTRTGEVAASGITTADGTYELVSELGATTALEFRPAEAATFTWRHLGTSATDSEADGNGSSGGIPVATAATYEDLDAGLLPANVLGGRLWSDDGDGIAAADEPGRASLRVELLAQDGTVVATTYSDANGTFAFVDPPPAVYRLRLILPPEIALAPFRAGSDGALDSDFRPVTAETDPIDHDGRARIDLGGALLAPADWVFADGFENGGPKLWAQHPP
jgi:uncharacterized delta-60 repeat protein